ncbi:MAG: hypothetical protein Q7K20_10295 [Polaromonas sp.]|nr:hypothetical protein [Polaromonas sp.]
MTAPPPGLRRARMTCRHEQANAVRLILLAAVRIDFLVDIKFIIF